MPVPEAPMHKDDGIVFRENDIRPAGQIFAMKPEAVPHPVKL